MFKKEPRTEGIRRACLVTWKGPGILGLWSPDWALDKLMLRAFGMHRALTMVLFFLSLLVLNL